MEINTAYKEVNKTARYSTYGELGDNTAFFWFVLHGSNMRCEQMIYKFADFDPKRHFIVAPEALNRQYLKQFGGEAVATWMTKRDRLKEIEDFSNYLSSLYSDFEAKLPAKAKKIVLGFSQGGTTLFRWLHARKVDADSIVAYSCWIPEDINLKESKTDLGGQKIQFTYGLSDQYLTPDRIESVNKVIEHNALEVEFLPYEGDHRVSKDQLILLEKKFDAL